MSKSESDVASRSAFWRSFGPGLVWAGTSIGVSHLVQSTRAGAMAGFGLVGVILAALVLKYPFFEYGARYAAATGTSLVEGYRRIGRWALWLYLGITLVTAVASLSAILMFTAFLTRFALGVDWPLPLVGTAVLAVCVAVVGVGKYRGLDLGIKIILALLCVSTLAAVVIALPRADPATLSLWPGELIGGVVPFAFLLALVGWMPSPIDVAVWSSLWTLAKDKDSGVRTTVRNARRDFLVGYLGTTVLAFAFVLLGATVLFQSGAALSEQGAVFSIQLVDMYTQTLGAWSRPFVLVAALTTMFSTTLALVDGFPRAIERTLVNLRAAPPPVEPQSSRLYWGTMIALGAIALLVLIGFAGSLTAMVDFATIVSFLTAPVLGYLNLTAVTSSDVPAEHRPGPAMLTLSWIGLLLLGGTGVAYLISLL